MTLLELTLVMSIMVIVVGALGGLARTVQQGFEYSEGYGIGTQHARVVLDRIAQNICQATANDQFPGCIVVAETVGSYRYPDALVVWRPRNSDGTFVTSNSPPPHSDGVPRYNELVIYCPNANAPNELLEIKPTNVDSVPALSDQTAWRTAVSTLRQTPPAGMPVLTGLLRQCSTASSGGGTSTTRGAVRFETRLRPSEADWASYKAGTTTWMNLPWVQGIYGQQAGLRQVWVRMELQLVPGVDWVSSNAATAQAVPFFGSAALYYNLSHP
jgi:hypothetical protein